MSAALAIAEERWPSPAGRPMLAVVDEHDAGRAWSTHTWFREPNPEQLAVFMPRIQAMIDYAARNGLRVGWFTFTSRSPAPRARHLRRAVVTADIARCWGRFRHKTAWRNVVAGLVVFATHGRPHVHVLAVMPKGLNLRSLRCAWSGGITHGELVRAPADAIALANYCAAQASASPRKALSSRRSFSYRAPPAEHLVYQPTPYTPAPPSPPPASPWRAAGGRAPFGETAATGQRAAPSWRPQADSGRPKAGGTSSGPGAGVEANSVCPPCKSEPYLRLIVSNPNPTPRTIMPTLVTPPLRHTSYDAVEVQIGINVLRTVMPRVSAGAVSTYAIVPLANLEHGLIEEVLMRLLYSGEVTRRKDGKVFAYWATPAMPSVVSVPIIVPDRLRHFMPMPMASSRP